MQPPGDPTGLVVEPYNSNTLTLSWDDNSEGESGFEIDRSTNNQDWISIGFTGADESVYVDTGLNSDFTYIYRVRATNGIGSSDESAPDSDTTYQTTTVKPINLSTRGTVGSGDSIMIAGLIILGNEPKDIYIRGLGPSLNVNESTPRLQDPELLLKDILGNTIDQNNDWQDHVRIDDINATNIQPANPKEAAIFATLPANTLYTVFLQGADGGTGAGSIEVYEGDPDDDAKMVNISTRGIVGAGDGLMIAGLIVTGEGSRTMYIRGMGPSLQTKDGPIEGRLLDTTLELKDINQQTIAFNDNWRDNSNFAGIEATEIPPPSPEEAALLINLPQGLYTILLRGKNDSEGIAIIEAYEIPDKLE